MGALLKQVNHLLRQANLPGQFPLLVGYYHRELKNLILVSAGLNATLNTGEHQVQISNGVPLGTLGNACLLYTSIFCYPRIEAGQPTVCSETCVGRIRYLGVLLYDADAIERAASTENEKDLYQRQLDVFLDPNDPKVIEQAIKDGIPLSVIEAAQQSPVYKMAMEWKLALPLHPEYRTLPMVWYVPPLSPLQSAACLSLIPI